MPPRVRQLNTARFRLELRQAFPYLVHSDSIFSYSWSAFPIPSRRSTQETLFSRYVTTHPFSLECNQDSCDQLGLAAHHPADGRGAAAVALLRGGDVAVGRSSRSCNGLLRKRRHSPPVSIAEEKEL
ncbi:unnamed protein product [Phaeothamnion confervicola]